MADRIYGPGEITARGEAIYQEKIRSRVDPVAKRKFVVIDVETCDYEVDAGDAAATRRLLPTAAGGRHHTEFASAIAQHTATSVAFRIR